MFDLRKFTAILRVKELRNKLLIVIWLIFVFRLAAVIPVPGLARESLTNLFAGNQLFGLLDIFSGGGLENFSVVAMGVSPYITSSIIFQLLIMVVPKLEQLQSEGEQGQKKINQYTRLLTVPLAVLQGYGLLAMLWQSSSLGGAGLPDPTGF